ncbi:phosphate ABC transporter permease PstA [Alteromonas halophila]|uniref:phosphate ABC transporter permease PstA n=1 Tax=Alteromonas halophila TaxID=516698 RepID=UPI0035711B78
MRNMTTAAQRQSYAISLSAFLCSMLLLVMISILMLIVVRGAAYFWPEPIEQLVYTSAESGEQKQVYAQTSLHQTAPHKVWQLQYSDARFPFGNKALVNADVLKSRRNAADAASVRLHDGRQLFARPLTVTMPQSHPFSAERFAKAQQHELALSQQIEQIRVQELAAIHIKLAEYDRRNVEKEAPAREKLRAQFAHWHKKILALEEERNAYTLQVAFANQQRYTLPLADIASLEFVSRLSWMEKWGVAFDNIAVFLTESPKQANTAGGVFPALFGTVLMVFLMTIIVTPFGVLAAVYLSEYAPDNGFTAAIRISVSNMAGVPSIVYGVFGLGFFVYTLGGNLDALFFTEQLPAPTFGTPGVFWAALTMAILTLPVVIVATEEGLQRVPDGLKAGSYALGATKAETIMRTILPIASPGIMTGVILAIARAAGEVAPLMLVGAVKFAPNLPVDGEFPYLHLERQFMHLGVLIYDGAFHSQTDAKGAPMMFAACLLLLAVVFVLNIVAVILRTRLRKRYLVG